MTYELMILEEIDLCESKFMRDDDCSFDDFEKLCKTARAAHELKAENEKLRAELEAANRAIARHEKLHRQGPRDAVDLG